MASDADAYQMDPGFVPILRENHNGGAFWLYKAMDFGLVDETGEIVNNEFIRIIAAN